MISTVLRPFEPSAAELRSLLERVDSPSVFQTYEMWEVYRKTRGCRPLLMAVARPDGGLASSLLSVVFEDFPFLAHASIRGGPICEPGKVGQSGGDFLLREHEARTRIHTLYTRLYPLSVNESWVTLARGCGFVRSDWLNFLVPIVSEREQWSMLHKDRRRGVQKAQDNGLTSREATSEADVQAIVRLLRKTAKAKRFPMQDASLFTAIHQCLVPHGMARMLIIEQSASIVATRVLLVLEDRVYDWYAGSDPRYRAMHPDTWAVWDVLRWAFERGLQVFDFGGAGVPGLPYGPREFKRQFGGTEVNLGRFTRDHFPRISGAIKRMATLYVDGAPL